MKIGGFQKLSLLDYPDHTCCTVFTQGCNLRCPYCHNALLIAPDGDTVVPPAEFFDFLQKRKGLLDGVCISGGEPMLQPDLEDFAARIKQLGFLVKLDTNGVFPKKLKSIVEKGLVDYVAMDIKSSPENYAGAAGLASFNTEPVEQSADFLMRGNVPFEFRTTVVRELHTEKDIVSIGRWLGGAPRYFLQRYNDSGSVLSPGLSAYSKAEMQQLLDAVKPFIPAAQLRGI